MRIQIDPPNERQKLFLEDRHKYVAYGGAGGAERAGPCG